MAGFYLQDRRRFGPNNNVMKVGTIALLALVIAGCGSSSSSTSTAGGAGRAASTTATAPKVTTTTVTRTATAPSPASSTATGTGGAAGGQCVAADLTLSSLGQQGGMGHGELGFSLRNTSARPCRTGGYPGILFLDAAGAPLPTTPTRVTQDFFGTTAVTRITLAPGQSASFRLGTTHEAQGNATCTTAAGVQVIAPNDTATMRTTVPNGVYECQTVTVSPLRPGGSAYP